MEIYFKKGKKKTKTKEFLLGLGNNSNSNNEIKGIILSATSERGQGHGILVEPRTKLLMEAREVLRVAGRATRNERSWNKKDVDGGTGLEYRKKEKKKKEGKIRERVVLFGKFARCLPSDSRIRFHGAVGTLGLSRSSTFHLVGTKYLFSTKRAERIPKVQLLWVFLTNGPNLLNFQLKYICK